jgi:hypothetical protein
MSHVAYHKYQILSWDHLIISPIRGRENQELAYSTRGIILGKTGGVMNDKDIAFHYVCTRDQAKEIAGGFDRYWVMNCGCREERGAICARSRMDLCLMFREDIEGSGGSGKKEISKAELEDIFKEAKEKHLVTRPFRNDKDRTKTEGICF